MTITPRAFLEEESKRNKANAQLWTEMLKMAFGPEWDVLIGHHIAFQRGSDIQTEEEVPAADTLIFDHGIMKTIFGERCYEVMQSLAVLPWQVRDHRLAVWFEQRKKAPQTFLKPTARLDKICTIDNCPEEQSIGSRRQDALTGH